MRNRNFWMTGIFFLSMMMFACEDASFLKDNPKVTDPQANSFMVKMTDNPGNFSELDVSITKVEAYLEDSGWVTLSSETQSFNVLDLTNGASITLAQQAEASAGTYSKLKFTFDEESELKVKATNELGIGGINTNGLVSFDLAFAGEKEVIVEIDQRIDAQTAAEVLVDFNVAQSIKQQGAAYILDPSIQWIEDSKTGVNGRLEAKVRAAIMVINKNSNDTVSGYTNAEGQFLIRGLEEGTCDVMIMPEEDMFNPTLPKQHRIEGVIVTEGQITHMGSIKF